MTQANMKEYLYENYQCLVLHISSDDVVSSFFSITLKAHKVIYFSLSVSLLSDQYAWQVHQNNFHMDIWKPVFSN